MPIAVGNGSRVAQVSGNRRTKLEEPAPYALVGNIQTPLRKEILHIPIAQSEPGIEPNGASNDFRWKAVTFEGDGVHPKRLHRNHQIEIRALNVTMPVRINAAIRSASGARVQHGGTLHPAPAGLPCSMNWFSLFFTENSLFDQTNSLFRGVGNSKLKSHDISGLGGFDPAYSRPNPRNSLFFPCKTGKSGQRRVRSRLRPPPRPYIFLILLRFL